MQHVNDKWLNYLAKIYTALVLLILIAGLAIKFLHASQAVADKWGITPFIMLLCGVQLLYLLLIYPLFRKKNNWLATLIPCVSTGILFASLIETSMQGNGVYRIGNALFIFLSAALGIFPPIAVIAVAWLMFAFTILSVLEPSKTPLPTYLLIVVFYTLSAVAGWLVFKKYYVQEDDEQSLELKSMLAQEQFKSNIILESITDGVIITDTKGTVQVLNEGAASMLGWAQDEAEHLDYRTLVQPESEEVDTQNSKDAITLCLESGKAEQKISLLQTHHGRHLYTDVVASPLFQKSQSKDARDAREIVGVIAVLRDVDKQKRTEQQRSDFISTASHEMRTPVASIQGFIELSLNPKVAAVDDKARGYLLKAQAATKHLGELFQDLLTVSKSDDGRLANYPKLIEVNAFLSELIEEDKIIAQKKGLSVVLESEQSREKTVTPLLYINADPDRLREVISNLFDNAVKYTKTGIITIGASLKEQGVVIRVSDTGMGIAEEDISHLFQKFYRTDNSATREIGGTGLGLYICKEIIEMMGGKIYVESTVGAGSTFFVELPRVSDPAQVTKNIA